jgi:hypothetical protein
MPGEVDQVFLSTVIRTSLQAIFNRELTSKIQAKASLIKKGGLRSGEGCQSLLPSSSPGIQVPAELILSMIERRKKVEQRANRTKAYTKSPIRFFISSEMPLGGKTMIRAMTRMRVTQEPEWVGMSRLVSLERTTLGK